MANKLIIAPATIRVYTVCLLKLSMLILYDLSMVFSLETFHLTICNILLKIKYFHLLGDFYISKMFSEDN